MVTSLDVKSLQTLVNIVYNYSCKWRFELSPTKCATMAFGKSVPKLVIKLGEDTLKQVNEYCHVGVTIRTTCVTDKKKLLTG